jgi:hypothetical protein
MSHDATLHELLNHRPGDRERATSAGTQALPSTMLRPLRSIRSALLAAKDIRRHVLWIGERTSALFHEPGWVELQPHRAGAVLFLNPARASKR